MTREQALLLLDYLGRAGPVVPVTVVQAVAMQPVFKAIAGVALGTITCSFEPVRPPAADETAGQGSATPSSRAKPDRASIKADSTEGQS